MTLPLIEKGQRTKDFSLSDEERIFLGFMITGASQSPRIKASPKSNWNERSQKRFAEFVPKIKHWVVVNDKYNNLPDLAATWYIDPPYQGQGIYYRYNCNKIDFNDLANFSKSRTGQVIVCENLGATWLPFEPLYTINGQANNKRTEAMWVNK